MTILQFRSPVKFPDGWVRTPQNAAIIDQQFGKNISIEEAVNYLQDEVSALGAHKAILHTNFDSITNDRQRSKRGHSEGAGLELTFDGNQSFIACDKWYHITQNLYALHLAVRHIHLFEEWGIATADFMLDMFAKSSHAGNNSTEHNRRATDNSPGWMDILGLGQTATLEDANAMYRHKAKKVASDQDKLIILNKAIEDARNSFT